MNVVTAYQHLEPRPRSNYCQLWVKGRHMRAEVLYREVIGPEQRTPDEVAANYDLPVAAILEAIEYCEQNPEILQADHDREQANVQNGS